MVRRTLQRLGYVGVGAENQPRFSITRAKSGRGHPAYRSGTVGILLVLMPLPVHPSPG